MRVETHENVGAFWNCNAPKFLSLTLASSHLPELLIQCSYWPMAPAAFAPGQQVWPVFFWMNLFLQVSGLQWALRPQFSDEFKNKQSYAYSLTQHITFGAKVSSFSCELLLNISHLLKDFINAMAPHSLHIKKQKQTKG